MKLRIIIAVVLQALTFAGNAQSQTVRDSAGIRIVDNPRPLWKPAEVLRLSDAPTLVIGSKVSPEYTFGRIRQVSRMSDGRIFVADGAKCPWCACFVATASRCASGSATVHCSRHTANTCAR